MTRPIRHLLPITLAIALILLDSVRGLEFRAWNSPVISLSQSVQLSLENHPSIQQAMADLGLAQLQQDAAYLPLNPTLALTGQVKRYTQLIPQQSSTINEPDLNLSFNLPIYDFGKVRWSAKAARLLTQSSFQDLKATLQTQVQTVQQNYANVLLAQEKVLIQERNLASTEGVKKISERLFRAGEVAEFNVINADSQVLSARSALVDAQTDLLGARASFFTDLGLSPRAEIRLQDWPDVPFETISFEEGLERALEQRPEVLSLRLQIESKEANAVASGLANAPVLSIYTVYDDLNEGVDFGRTTDLGLQLSWTPFDGGVARNQAAQNRMMAEQLRAQLAVTERDITQSLARTFGTLESQAYQVEISTSSVERASESLQISKRRYEAGLSDITEVSQARSALTQAELDLAQALASYRGALVSWQRDTTDFAPIIIPDELRRYWEDDPYEVR